MYASVDVCVFNSICGFFLCSLCIFVCLWTDGWYALGNASLCVCVSVCARYNVHFFFQIHTVTPMCPAIDLEMTGLLTHTICSANEERHREGVRENEIFSQSILYSIQKYRIHKKHKNRLVKLKEQQKERLCEHVCEVIIR